MASESVEELLFFDTFSHDATGEINLDLVQFPKPVIISEIRIIPLGARVQADFPGGVRLGATNPSQFKIDFFVNDLSKPEASTFERLGALEYKQNVDIQLECGQRKILTDGLVLKGLYTTITLAVYGILNKGIPPPAPIVPERRTNDISVSNATAEWVQQHAQVRDQSQDTLYMDQTYNYGQEYQQGSQDHNYVEGWPITDVPPPNVPLQHNDGYQPGSKKYETSQSWDTTKTWEHPPPENSTKPEHIGSPVRSLNSDSRDWGDKKDDDKEKLRSRDERDKYWDDSTEIRDEREHSRMREDRIGRNDKDTERDDRSRDRRNDKERDWRRRDDGDERERDRYAREKERKEREGSVKDDLSRERSKCLKERDRSSLRDERTSSRGRRERERSIDRPSWREKSLESELRHRSSKSFRESSWERERERERERDRERDRDRERERERERNRDRSPCSDASNYRKRLKSPPTRSPRRPHTPTERFWSPDARGEYNSPTGRQVYHELHEERRRSPVASPHSKLHSPQTPVLSPAKYVRTEKNSQSPNYGQSPLVQDEPSLDEEQFEPILSDEDIIDESDSQYQDMDYDFPDDMEEIVKPFNPFTFTVQPLEYFVDPSLTPCEKEQILQLKLKSNKDNSELIQIHNLIKGVSLEDPSNIKEDWVQAVEQLLPLLDKGLASVTPSHPVVPILLKWVDVGLDLDIAICHSQPAFKVRHIKAGIRLTDGICSCGLWFVDELVVRCHVQQKLLQLFHKEYMALSIKLMILKALDSTFISEKSLEFFLKEDFTLNVGNTTTEKLNGYQHLFRILEEKQLVRVKFAITSLIKKIHTHEMLENLRKHIEETTKLEECEYDSEVLLYLKEIEKLYLNADVMISQPKRFLPVESQFEINISSATSFMFLYKYFKIHKVLEILLILLSNRKTNTSIVTMVQNLIRHFSDKQDGLAFLSSNQEVTNNILKALCCQTSEEYIEVIPGTTTYLGMEITCRLQVLQHLDRIVCLENKDEVFDILHELYSISFTSIGKLQIAFVLSLEDNLQVLLDLLQNTDEKSAVRNYVFDLLIMTIKYSDDVSFLRKFGKKLLDLAESDKQSHIHDVVQWLKPLEIPNIISYEDITPLCDILKKHTTLDGCASLPGDLITCLRILRFLGIPKNESDLSVLPYEEEYTELKYKYVILQLYSSDCLSHLNAILAKILEFYEQPFVHSISLLGIQGSNLLSFIEPCVMLMRRMLTYVISVRNNEYKDLTHINVLIQVFTLMQAFQPNSECFPNSQKVCRDIVETLLAYTQPVADENASETETFTKSLWTLMISDVLKYITKSSFTFIPGFLLLSELLPLPTPIPSKSELTKEEINQIINSRKLWSAHLHTLSFTIHDLIATMAGSSYAPLLQLVRRVCLQLADLAAPTALVVSRAVLDPLLTSLQKPQTDTQIGVSWEIPCVSQALRLLNFLACLVSHSSIKAAVLSLLTVSGVKSDEKYLSLVNGFAIILRTPSSVVTHTQVQEHVILIMQALFDSDVTLTPVSALPPTEDVSANEVFMANALPPKELLNTFINALLDHIANQEHTFLTILSALKALMLLTEHDYGFFHLKNCIEAKSEALWNVFEKISSNVSKENNDSLSALCTALDFMRELVNVGEDVEMSGLPPRSMTISSQELANAVRWGAAEGEKPHPIAQLESLLKEWSSGDESFISLHENLEGLVKLLNAGGERIAEEKEAAEIVLPAPMPLNAQFSSRPVYVIGDVDDKKLYSVYWLSLPTCDDSDQEMDQIGCDLIELANSVLPDYLLPHEVERICMLKTTDDEEDPKKPQTSKYHFSGAKTRRPFITPMRGRGLGRAAPQRGDLFRSRPPNTSRPPSLHVDDFVALETCGQQPTGPTGYNKISMRAVKDIIATRTRGRGGRVYPTERGRFFGAPTYPRRESPRGLLRGRGSWLQHEEAARQFHLSERLPLRTEATLGRFLGRGRALPPWSTRSEQFGGIPIRSIRSEPSRHLRTFIR